MKHIDLNEINKPLDNFACKGKIPTRIINNVAIGADFIADNEEEIGIIAIHMNSDTYAFVLCDGFMYKIEKYTKTFNTYTVSMLLSRGKFYGEE